jgi:hypothetical protein
MKIAVSEPVNDVVELGGPEQFRLDELARRVLRANNDPRPVTADVHARYFGAELAEHSLTPGSSARIAPTGSRTEGHLRSSASGSDVSVLTGSTKKTPIRSLLARRYPRWSSRARWARKSGRYLLGRPTNRRSGRRGDRVRRDGRGGQGDSDGTWAQRLSRAMGLPGRIKALTGWVRALSSTRVRVGRGGCCLQPRMSTSVERRC